MKHSHECHTEHIFTDNLNIVQKIMFAANNFHGFSVMDNFVATYLREINLLYNLSILLVYNLSVQTKPNTDVSDV